MPRKGKRKSSFGRTSKSDGAKRFAKHSQEKDDYNENKAKQMRIKRWVPLINFLFLFSFLLMLNNPVNSCHKKQEKSIMMWFDTIVSILLKHNVKENYKVYNGLNSYFISCIQNRLLWNHNKTYCKILSIHIKVIVKSC